MAHQSFGRQIVRGTICRDSFRAEVTLTCSDTQTVGQVTPLLVDLRWRTAQPADAGASTGPDDARIALSFAHSFDAATGDLRFDSADGPTSVALATATGPRVLHIAAAAASAGTEPDILLQVSVDGEITGSLPLSAAADPGSVEIRAADGTAAAPDAVIDGRPLVLHAVPRPAVAGTYTWSGVPAELIEVTGQTADGTPTVVGHRGAAAAGGAAGSVCVLFTPTGAGPSVLAEHRLAVDPD